MLWGWEWGWEREEEREGELCLAGKMNKKRKEHYVSTQSSEGYQRWRVGWGRMGEITVPQRGKGSTDG